MKASLLKTSEMDPVCIIPAVSKHAKMRCPLNTANTYQYPSSKPFPGPVCDQIYDPIRDKISNSISDQTNKQFCDLFYETIFERSCEPFHGPLSVPFDQNRQSPGSLQNTVRQETQNLNRQYPPPKLQLLAFLIMLLYLIIILLKNSSFTVTIIVRDHWKH